MSYFIKAFLLFLTANYLLFFTYDNFYLTIVEESYLTESRDQLRSYALELRTDLSVNQKEEAESLNIQVINEFAKKYNIPSQIINKDGNYLSADIIHSLNSNDYIIELFGASGPAVYLNLNNKSVVEIGPLDPLVMQTTTMQPLFITLMFLVNAITSVICYWFIRKKIESVEGIIEDVANRQQIAPEVVGEQNLLRQVVQNILKLESYIDEIEVTNHRVIDDQRDLMHAVAHELRSPIARISFALDLVEEGDTSPENKKLLREMHSSLNELESLIKEILGYSRLSHEKMKPKLEEVEVFSLVRGVTERLQLIYSQEAFEIKSDFDALNLQCDPKLIERAVVNLLRNAGRFAKSKIKVSMAASNNTLFVSIEDDGIGIPPGKRERIFEAFTRLDPSRSRDSGGVGLGLAIVKKIVDLHYGTISVEDSELGGAKFVLTIPIK